MAFGSCVGEEAASGEEVAVGCSAARVGLGSEVGIKLGVGEEALLQEANKSADSTISLEHVSHRLLLIKNWS